MKLKPLITNTFLNHYLYKNARTRAGVGMFGQAVQELKVAPSQFLSWKYPFNSVLNFFRVILSVLIRLSLGRNAKVSYAFYGEDRIIEGILKPRFTKMGYYVEVGSNHPKFISNTYGLYRKGWRGLCIDANAHLIIKHKKCRPRDKAVCGLVSDHTGERSFFQVENDVLSTASPQNLEEIRREGLYYREQKFDAQTLTELMSLHKVPPLFDLLSIDAEEHDYEVLKGLDFHRFRPRLIVVEDETFKTENPNQNVIYKLLMEQGYRLEGFVLKNLYFLDRPLV